MLIAEEDNVLTSSNCRDEPFEISNQVQLMMLEDGWVEYPHKENENYENKASNELSSIKIEIKGKEMKNPLLYYISNILVSLIHLGMLGICLIDN